MFWKKKKKPENIPDKESWVSKNVDYVGFRFDDPQKA